MYSICIFVHTNVHAFVCKKYQKIMKKVRLTNRRMKTTYLLPKRNFIIGMGSIFNLKGSYFDYDTSPTERIADRRAIENDWRMVGQDIRNAKQKLENCY